MTNLYIDLETIPDQAPGAFDRIYDAIKPPGNIKKPESIEKWMVENGSAAAAEAHQKTSFNGLYGEICSIAWAIDDGEIIGNCRRPDTTEAWLLQHFFDCIAQETKSGEGEHPRLTWIGHNVIDFDLRFLKQRAIVNDVRPPFIIPADARHGSNDVFDTMKAWAGWKGYVSQDALCDALGIDGKGDMDGSEVWPAYQRQEYDTIQEYNINDVRIVRELYQRMS